MILYVPNYAIFVILFFLLYLSFEFNITTYCLMLIFIHFFCVLTLYVVYTMKIKNCKNYYCM